MNTRHNHILRRAVLAATLALPLILAVRSLAILLLSLALGGRPLLRAVFTSRVRWLLLRRAVVNLGPS